MMLRPVPKIVDAGIASKRPDLLHPDGRAIALMSWGDAAHVCVPFRPW